MEKRLSGRKAVQLCVLGIAEPGACFLFFSPRGRMSWSRRRPVQSSRRAEHWASACLNYLILLVSFRRQLPSDLNSFIQGRCVYAPAALHYERLCHSR
jgi:hypothetical protein